MTTGEPLAVVGLPVVEPADLLIDVSLKVEGRDRNVSPFEGTFQQLQKFSMLLVWTFPRTYSVAWSITSWV
jgi:hypothetical protein